MTKEELEVFKSLREKLEHGEKVCLYNKKHEAKVCLYNKKYAESHGGKAQYTLNIKDIIEIKPDFQLKGLTVKYYSGFIVDDKGCQLPEETTVDYIKIL